jgi:hypothetical protein
VVRRKASGKATLIQTGLRLEAEILDRLRSSDRGLSDEIRERLERTFKEDTTDPATRELCQFLVNLTVQVHRDFNMDWHRWPKAHAAFTAAVAQRLAGYTPPPTHDAAATDLLGPHDPPETIGRLRETDDRRAGSYPVLVASLKRWAAAKTASFGRAMRAKKETNHD